MKTALQLMCISIGSVGGLTAEDRVAAVATEVDLGIRVLRVPEPGDAGFGGQTAVPGEQVAVGAIVEMFVQVELVESDCAGRVIGEQEVPKFCARAANQKHVVPATPLSTLHRIGGRGDFSSTTEITTASADSKLSG